MRFEWPPKIDPRLFSRVENPTASVQIRYLGSAGLVVQAQQHTLVLDSAAAALSADREIVPEAVGQNALALESASGELEADREVALLANLPW